VDVTGNRFTSVNPVPYPPYPGWLAGHDSGWLDIIVRRAGWSSYDVVLWLMQRPFCVCVCVCVCLFVCLFVCVCVCMCVCVCRWKSHSSTASTAKPIIELTLPVYLMSLILFGVSP